MYGFALRAQDVDLKFTAANDVQPAITAAATMNSTIWSMADALRAPASVVIPSDGVVDKCAPLADNDSARTELQAAPTPSQVRSGGTRARDATSVAPMDLAPAGTPRSASSANTLLFLAGVVAAPTPS